MTRTGDEPNNDNTIICCYEPSPPRAKSENGAASIPFVALQLRGKRRSVRANTCGGDGGGHGRADIDRSWSVTV